MNVYVLDSSFRSVGVLDVYKSLIWTDRYYECGDFEIYTVANTDVFNLCKIGNYLVTTESEHSMIVETQKLQSDVEAGDYVTISGRSLESILDRRIVWGMTTLTGNLQNAIKKLLTENVINPTDEKRKIPNFIFKESTDTAITDLTIDVQYTGDCLYNIINDICVAYEIGFRVYFDKDYNIIFELYSGTDRSSAQMTNPHIIFSPSFDNILNSNYIMDITGYKTTTLVGGEDQDANRRYQTKELESEEPITGLERREIFTDARDLSSTDENGNNISADQYNTMLQQRGLENLYENSYISSFDGQTETGLTFEYGKDYYIGDVVNVEDEYGHSSVSRITEFIISEDDSGFYQYPTFEAI